LSLTTRPIFVLRWASMLLILLLSQEFLLLGD